MFLVVALLLSIDGTANDFGTVYRIVGYFVMALSFSLDAFLAVSKFLQELILSL